MKRYKNIGGAMVKDDTGKFVLLEDVLDFIDKFKWKLKDVNNKEINEAIHYTGYEVFMDMHNENLEELKTQLEKI